MPSISLKNFRQNNNNNNNSDNPSTNLNNGSTKTAHQTYNIAVVGATGQVGCKIIEILLERNFPIKQLFAIASKQSAGKEITIKYKKNQNTFIPQSVENKDKAKISDIVPDIKREERCEFLVHDFEKFDFSQVDYVLSSANSEISNKLLAITKKHKIITIDNSSFYRMHSDVPLIVPEINGNLLQNIKPGSIIANPNCSTIQLVLALNPLHKEKKFGTIKRVIVSTYQSVSGAGLKGISTLEKEIKQYHKECSNSNITTDNSPLNDYENNALTNNMPPQNPINKEDNTTHQLIQGKNIQGKNSPFQKNIAFNAIPHIDIFLKNRSTKEEWKLEVETSKIMNTHIPLHANCARIPALNCHAEYINLEFSKEVDLRKVADCLARASGILVYDDIYNNVYNYSSKLNLGIYNNSTKTDTDTNTNTLYATPWEVSGNDHVFISRLRYDYSTNAVNRTNENYHHVTDLNQEKILSKSISFWCVGDNLRKGAALNAVQILEKLISLS